MKRHLDARGKGEYSYDYANDILLFKIKDRDYKVSVEFDNIVADFDTAEFLTGLRIFDASKIFGLPKEALRHVSGFEFKNKVENKVVNIQLKFMIELRNKQIIRQGQDFIRESIHANLGDSEVLCTVA